MNTKTRISAASTFFLRSLPTIFKTSAGLPCSHRPARSHGRVLTRFSGRFAQSRVLPIDWRYQWSTSQPPPGYGNSRLQTPDFSGRGDEEALFLRGNCQGTMMVTVTPLDFSDIAHCNIMKWRIFSPSLRNRKKSTDKMCSENPKRKNVEDPFLRWETTTSSSVLTNPRFVEKISRLKGSESFLFASCLEQLSSHKKNIGHLPYNKETWLETSK